MKRCTVEYLNFAR